MYILYIYVCVCLYIYNVCVVRTLFIHVFMLYYTITNCVTYLHPRTQDLIFGCGEGQPSSTKPQFDVGYGSKLTLEVPPKNWAFQCQIPIQDISRWDSKFGKSRKPFRATAIWSRQIQSQCFRHSARDVVPVGGGATCSFMAQSVSTAQNKSRNHWRNIKKLQSGKYWYPLVN